MAKERTDWVKIWIDDKESMIATMRANLAADLAAGYNPNGYSIRKQLVDVETYERNFDTEIERLKGMEESKANWWCWLDLRKRGAIS